MLSPRRTEAFTTDFASAASPRCGLPRISTISGAASYALDARREGRLFPAGQDSRPRELDHALMRGANPGGSDRLCLIRNAYHVAAHPEALGPIRDALALQDAGIN
jgi:hypothetical protein